MLRAGMASVPGCEHRAALRDPAAQLEHVMRHRASANAARRPVQPDCATGWRPQALGHPLMCRMGPPSPAKSGRFGLISP